MEYELTAKGEDLRPVMRAMVEWGVRHAGGRILRRPGRACNSYRLKHLPVAVAQFCGSTLRYKVIY